MQTCSTVDVYHSLISTCTLVTSFQL